jgi:hypothetical protein
MDNTPEIPEIPSVIPGDRWTKTLVIDEKLTTLPPQV